MATGPLAALAAASDRFEVWHPEYEVAASEAQATGRPMLIHFYAEWCGPCRLMEQHVLNQPSVADGLRERVVAVKVNYDHRADLVRRFNIGALPCDLLVDCDGEVLMRTSGYVGELTYLEQIVRMTPAVTPSQNSTVVLLVVSSAAMGHSAHSRDLGAVELVGTRLLAASVR